MFVPCSGCHQDGNREDCADCGGTGRFELSPCVCGSENVRMWQDRSEHWAVKCVDCHESGETPYVCDCGGHSQAAAAWDWNEEVEGVTLERAEEAKERADAIAEADALMAGIPAMRAVVALASDPDGIGAYYEQSRLDAVRVRLALEQAAKPSVRKVLERRLEMAVYVGD